MRFAMGNASCDLLGMDAVRTIGSMPLRRRLQEIGHARSRHPDRE